MGLVKEEGGGTLYSLIVRISFLLQSLEHILSEDLQQPNTYIGRSRFAPGWGDFTFRIFSAS